MLLRIQMTVKSHILPNLRDTSRRASGCALYLYYYGYFAARAETV